MIDPTGAEQQSELTRESEHLFRLLLVRARRARLFRSPDCRHYVKLPIGCGQDIYRIDSPAFRDWLKKGLPRELPAPTDDALIRRVIARVETRARTDHMLSPIFMRIGSDGIDASSNFFIDLGDESGRAIKIRSRGWSIVNRPTIHFRRCPGLRPLPVPSRDGSIDTLRSYVNLTESHFRRAVVWLASGLVPCGPRPILVLQGDEGASRSTLARIFGCLIDPQDEPFLAVPQDMSALFATAADRWMLAYDDVGALRPWLVDALGELARAPSFARDPGFLTAGTYVSLGARPVILTGVDDLERHGALRDVSIGLPLPPIAFDNRRGEVEFWRAFQADYPRILGGLLDVLAQGLGLAHAERDTV